MKKLMIAASAALCAAVGFADIQSSNVVGYNAITIDKKNTIMSVQFQNVSGNSLTIQEAFPAQEGMTQGPSANAADQIQVQNDKGGYDTYFLSNGKNARGQAIAGLEPGTWVLMTAATKPATVTFAPGQAFWYIAMDASAPYTVNVAGQVLADEYIDIDIVKKNQHLACPYPTDLPINNIVAISGTTQGPSANAADQIQVQNDKGGYDTYFLSNGKNARGQAIAGLEPGDWVLMTAATKKATGAIPVGKGAWFIRFGDETATIRVNRPW